MTPEAQRIAIAEADGFIAFSSSDVGFKPGVRGPLRVPDYLTDLNAMHEAENTLDGYMMHRYVTELLALTGGPGTAGSFSHVHATAAQRAEAFLRTIGKWEEASP